jgi:Mg2+ and Co2+ transporter CorA
MQMTPSASAALAPLQSPATLLDEMTTVRSFAADGMTQHQIADLGALLRRDSGFVWVDFPKDDDEAKTVLEETFGFHPLAIRDCFETTPVPKIHAYPDHLFLVLHAPESGTGGHVHMLELNQFVGRRYLVTLHEAPVDVDAHVAEAASERETRLILGRIDAGRFLPATPAELSHAIVAALVRRMEQHVWGVATRVAELERHVIDDDRGEPHAMLEAMFRLRHELLSVRTIAVQSREVYARISGLTGRETPTEGRQSYAGLLDPSDSEDLVRQFERVRGTVDGEREFLDGVVEFFQTRTSTRINVAMERLALLTAVLLPITAIASVYGMNIIVNAETQATQVAGVIALMIVVTVVMLAWTRRQGWW